MVNSVCDLGATGKVSGWTDENRLACAAMDPHNQVMASRILFFGGSSDERLVSVASAQNLAAQFLFDELWFFHAGGAIAKTTLDELRSHNRPFQETFRPRPEPFAQSLSEASEKLKGCTIFLGFHGDEGEDGKIQAWLEERKIPFTGSGSKASALCFDKKLAKAGLAGLVPTATGIEVTADSLDKLNQFYQEHRQIVVKPVASGSSFGLFIVTDDVSYQKAVQGVRDLPYGRFLAETFLEGRELTVGYWDGHGALPASEVIMNRGRSFDYEGKYLGKGSTEITPASVSAAEMKQAQELAEKCHRALGCYGYSRTDMMLTKNGPVFIETNTLPGMTRASFYPQQLEAAKLDIRRFIETQLELAKHRYE